MSDSLSLGGGRHHFFEAMSLSIALLSIASANSFFSLALESRTADSVLAADVGSLRLRLLIAQNR
jgi:hypothetical protein